MKLRFCCTLGLAFLAAVSSVSLGMPATRGGGMPLEHGHAMAQSSCQGWCTICDLFENLWVVTPSELPNDEDRNVVCGHHVPCPNDCWVSANTSVDRIVHVVASADDEQLRLLMHQVPRLKVNAARKALQLDGCQPGTVVMNLPMSEHQMAIATADVRTRVAQR